MKKIYFFLIVLIVAALGVIGVSAKSIYIWRNGANTELPIQTNDSITFDAGNDPIMHIWRNGSEIYQLALAVNDSITASKNIIGSSTDTLDLDYYNWRTRTMTRKYVKEGNPHWDTIYLPWNPGVRETTMPTAYATPNLEYHVNSKTNDSIPVWELAFNLFPDRYLEHERMFGLWDRKGKKMRIYSYIDKLPNSLAHYYYYQVTTDTPALIEKDAKAFMPSDSVLRHSEGWSKNSIQNKDAQPSTTLETVMPILRDPNPQSPFNAGWVCFELDFSSSNFLKAQGGRIQFDLKAVMDITIIGKDTLDFSLSCDSCSVDGSLNGNIKNPGNKTSVLGGWLNGGGDFVSGLIAACAAGSGIYGTYKVNDAAVANRGVEIVSALAAIAGGIGAFVSGAGTVVDAYNNQGPDSTSSSIRTKANLGLDLDFHGSAGGGFNAQMTSTVGTYTGCLDLSYEKFFEEVIAHNTLEESSGSPSKARRSNGTDDISFGLWNLKRQPVFYVCGDAKVDSGSLCSFIDPASIELMISHDNVLFDYDEIDSIQLVACDFSFVDDDYGFSNRPYYGFYRIHRDNINIARTPLRLGLTDTTFLLNDTAAYQTFTKNGISYTGVVPAGVSDIGIGQYTLVYSPRISTALSSPELDYLGVSVVLVITFKDGQKRIFADRFLPEIKTFSYTKADSLQALFQSYQAPTALDGIPLKMPLFDMQKEKAIRLLESVSERTSQLVKIDENTWGVRIREWQECLL